MQFSDQKINEVKSIVLNKYKTKYPDKMSRFDHILGVAKMCEYLANIYNIDKSRAIICGLVHDFYKYESEEEMKTLIDPKDLEECEKFPVLYHSYASSEALKKVFNIDDLEMKSAIRNHVFGHTNMTRLEEIVLISDYTEENRTYKDCITVRNILLSSKFNEAIYLSTLYTINFLKKQNKTVHPMQLDVLYEYERKLIMDKIKTIYEGLKRVNPHDIVCYDTNLSSPFFKFVLIASVDSERQANVSVDYIKEELAKEGYLIKASEGENSGWVLIDGFDFLVHVMTDSERERIDLDKLFINYEKIDLSSIIEE